MGIIFTPIDTDYVLYVCPRPSPRAYLSHVFLACQDQLMVDDPVRLPLEESRGRVDEDGRLLHYCLVPLHHTLKLENVPHHCQKLSLA